MFKRTTYSPTVKLLILEELAQGKTYASIEKEYGAVKSTIFMWKAKYEREGPEGLEEKSRWSDYPEATKQMAVQDYLNGQGGYKTIARRYGLSGTSVLRIWIRQYTEGKDLSPTSGGRCKMASRKTTYKERIEIVQHCDAHNRNYRETAELYQVSYQQVYGWIRKYDEGGEKALIDRRGKPKEETKLSEVDRLNLEIRKLKRQNRDLEVENALLKKLQELERQSH